MNRSSSKGFKLTTVLVAVVFLAVSAIFSNASAAQHMEYVSLIKVQ